MTCVLHFRHILLRDLEDNLSGLSFYLLRRKLDIYRYIVLIHDHHLDRHIERHLVRNLSIDPRASVRENIVYEILIKSVLDPLDGYGAKFRCRSLPHNVTHSRHPQERSPIVCYQRTKTNVFFEEQSVRFPVTSRS